MRFHGKYDDVPVLTDIEQPSNRMAAILARYQADLACLQRKYGLELSPQTVERMEAFYSGWLEALGALPFDELNQNERIDWILFRNHLELTLKRMHHKAAHNAQAAQLIPFDQQIIRLNDELRAMRYISGEEAAAALHAIEQTARAAIKNLPEIAAAGTVKRTTASLASRNISRLLEVLKDWHTFYHGYDPAFNWWTERTYQTAREAIEAYDRALKEQLIGSVSADDAADIIGEPIGRDALIDDLRYEMVPYTPEELIEIAESELKWCEKELAAAAAELGFGNDTAAAVEYAKQQHAQPGSQAELVKELAEEAIEYLAEHDLLTVPPLAREVWRLDMMSAEKQKVNPFFLGGEVIQVSFPTHTMSYTEKQMSMRGNNAPFSRATVQHELIPGHHMQFFMVERYNSHRSPFHTPFWIEGWTIYWELLLYKRGFPRSPEERIGMLFWRMHRCVRVVFSLSFHMELMSPAECIEMLVERVGHERANAIAEVRRSCSDAYPPLYQCAYLIGGLQVWALRRELVDSGKMPEKAFHDLLVKQNIIPIELCRAAMAGTPLTADYEANWRFYTGLAGE
jgi:uncharacterized protein (DUF885 family)